VIDHLPESRSMTLRATLKLGLLGLLLAAAVSSCSGQDVPAGPRSFVVTDGNHGGLKLALVPVSGVTLSLVHYVVTNGATPAVIIGEGDIPAPGSSGDINLGLSLPVGTGYKVSLSAASAEVGDNITCGAAFGPLNVLPNTVQGVELVLTCHDDTNGSGAPGLQVTTDACPRLAFDYVTANPPRGGIGAPNINVLAAARDLDGKAVTYSWKVSNPAAATFTPSTGPASTLACNSASSNLLATVTATNGDCTKALSIEVQCIADYGGSCGNGRVDPGETCDTAIPGTKCPADCTSVCGDGVAEAPAEDCDPGNTDNCTAACSFRTPVCGDGFLTTIGPKPEVCDGNEFASLPPPGTICNDTCDGFTDASIVQCGDGIVGTAEECDDSVPPFPASPVSATCSGTCQKISTPACVACEKAGDCFESVDNCKGVAAPFSAAQQTSCFDVMTCIEKSNCFDGTNTLGRCYCGSLNTTQCGAAPFTGPGSPDGACVAQIKAGFPTFTANSQVIAGLVATNFPSGAAMKRLSCQKGANSSACLDACGFTGGGPAFP
jgi:hypothetical protein